MNKLLKEWFSEKDNQTMCLVRGVAFLGALEMLYKFLSIASPSFQDFGIGLGTILATVVAKNFTEGK